jgi:MOSC domain-containing protein YiiM
MGIGEQPQIVALFRPREKGEHMEPLSTAEVIADFGLAGDRKARPGSRRQVLLMDAETVEEFGFKAGDLDENITTRDLPVSALQRGQRLRIGDVLLEVTIERPSCHKLEELRVDLATSLEGRRGKMTVVLEGGTIRVGDQIEVVD